MMFNAYNRVKVELLNWMYDWPSRGIPPYRICDYCGKPVSIQEGNDGFEDRYCPDCGYIFTDKGDIVTLVAKQKACEHFLAMTNSEQEHQHYRKQLQDINKRISYLKDKNGRILDATMEDE